MTENDLKAFCIHLIKTSGAAVLTSIDEYGYPCTRAMLNLRNAETYPSLIQLFDSHRDDLLIYFTTSTNSKKVKQIRKNPKVSVYYHIPEKFEGVMMQGDIELVDDYAIHKSLWQEGWEMYYPTGYDDPDHTVLRLLPRIARGWHGTSPFELNIGNSG